LETFSFLRFNIRLQDFGQCNIYVILKHISLTLFNDYPMRHDLLYLYLYGKRIEVFNREQAKYIFTVGRFSTAIIHWRCTHY